MKKHEVRITKTSDPVVIDVTAEDLKKAKEAALDVCMAGIPELKDAFENGEVEIDVRK